MRRLLPLLLLPALGAAAPAPAAARRKSPHRPRSSYVAAPSYPRSRLAIALRGNPRVHGLATVVVTGSNRPLDGIAYSLDLFVQVRSVYGRCPRSLAAERQRVIDTPGPIAHIASDLSEGPGRPFRIPVTYRVGSARRVVLCAYSSYIVDDAAESGLRWTFGPRKR